MRLGKTFILMFIWGVMSWAICLPVFAEDYVPNEVLVKWKDQPELPDAVSTVRVSDVSTALDLFGQDDRVEYVEPNYQRYLAAVPNDPAYNDQQYLEQITDSDLDMEAAWEQSTGSSNVVVAVIDTGLDMNHADLVDNIWVNTAEIPDNGMDDDQNGYIDDVHGWDFVSNDDDPSAQPTSSSFTVESVIHGTHVAGIIGAVGNNGVGVTGLNWDVSVMPLKVFDDNGESDAESVTAAIAYAVANGADIINMSYGGTSRSQTEADALAAAADSGVILVAAAGNTGDNLNSTPFYPACFDNVIGVGAVDDGDEIAFFSNFGDDCVDLAAPGLNIYNTYYYDDTGTYGTLQQGEYGYMSGTSMAAPMISGVAALALAVNPDFTPAEVLSALTSSADDIGDDRLGAGRVNAANALAIVADYAAPDAVVISSYHRSDLARTIAAAERTRDAQPYFQWETPESVAAVVGYYVYFGRDRLDPVTDGALQAGLTYTPTLPADSEQHTYRLRVKALDAAGLTSNLSQFLYTIDRHIARPTWQSLSQQSDGSVLLQWYRPAGEHAQAYKVYRSEDRLGHYQSLSGQITLRKFTDTTVQPGRRYYYKVRAIDDLGNLSSLSAIETIRL